MEHYEESMYWGNVAEWVPADGGFRRAVRVSEPYRNALPWRTAENSFRPAGVELRFRSDSGEVVLELAGPQRVDFRAGGSEWSSAFSVPDGGGHKLVLTSSHPGSHIWRVRFGREHPLLLCSVQIEASMEPAPPSGVRWLAHGSSITEGGNASRPINTYVWRTADLLGWTPINLGFGGSCWGDRASAFYIASRDDWDILTLEIGINTVGLGIDSPKTFELGYEVFLEVIRERHPEKPIVCISPFWCRWDEEAGPQAELLSGVRKAIDAVVDRRTGSDRNLHFVDGRELITGPEHLEPDLVHPNDAGMAHIAQVLAPRLRDILS